MTDKEKARAYDEVLLKAKNHINIKGIGETVELCQELFPQLFESEDEKIRKAIIKSIEEDSSVYEQEVSKEQMLAYLEKQKKHPMSAEEVLIKAGLKAYKDGNQWCILVGDNIQEGICGFGDTIDEALYEFLMEVIEKRKEQKPVEPSDEELQRYQDELYDFKVFAAKQAKEHHISYIHDFEWNNFCAELLSYFNEKQKSVEWSEDDEKMVRFYADDYNNNIGNMPMCDVIENRIKFKDWLLNRLKSLHPSWKPSEEQMEALLNAEKYLNAGLQYGSARRITELIEQFKKLM